MKSTALANDGHKYHEDRVGAPQGAIDLCASCLIGSCAMERSLHHFRLKVVIPTGGGNFTNRTDIVLRGSVRGEL